MLGSKFCVYVEVHTDLTVPKVLPLAQGRRTTARTPGSARPARPLFVSLSKPSSTLLHPSPYIYISMQSRYSWFEQAPVIRTYESIVEILRKKREANFKTNVQIAHLHLLQAHIKKKTMR